MKTALQWKAERHPIIPLQQSEASQTDNHFLNKEKSLKIRFVEKGAQLGYGRHLKEPFNSDLLPQNFVFVKNRFYRTVLLALL